MIKGKREALGEIRGALGELAATYPEISEKAEELLKFLSGTSLESDAEREEARKLIESLHKAMMAVLISDDDLYFGPKAKPGSLQEMREFARSRQEAVRQIEKLYFALIKLIS